MQDKNTTKKLYICENDACKKEFKPTRNWQRFCTDECRFLAWIDNNPRISLKKIEEAYSKEKVNELKDIIEYIKKKMSNV